LDHHLYLTKQLAYSGPLLAITSEMTTVLVVLLLILLFVSFCVSGAQIAFFSLNFKDINYLKTKQQPPYKRIITLIEQPKNLMAALIIANYFANIGIILISSFLISQFVFLQNHWLEFVLKVVVIWAIIGIFAEILPKTFAGQNNIRFAKDVGWLVEGLYLLFKGLASRLVNFSDNIEKALGQKSMAASLEELNHAIDLTTESEATEEEKNILKGIIKFGNITVKQVMRTRLDVNGINYKCNFEDLKKRVEDLHHSRLPVYSGSLDEIKGIIHTKDLLPYLGKEASFDWRTLMRPAYFVHEQKLIEDLMQEFQLKHVHFAVVADEFGGTSGIITLEDILEEVIGEITDEFDEIETGNKKIDDMNYIFEGKTMLNDVRKIMNLAADTFDKLKGESDSLAGLLLEIAGEIPTVNQEILADDFKFTVLEVNRNRIQKVKVTIKSGE
jgi:gliding motility-associated protein GldE